MSDRNKTKEASARNAAGQAFVKAWAEARFDLGIEPLPRRALNSIAGMLNKAIDEYLKEMS